MLTPWTATGVAGSGTEALHYRLRLAAGRATSQLVLVHSLGLDSTLWNAVVARLPESVDVCAYDCRGHGRSGAGIGACSLLAAAGDLARVLDHVGWPRSAIAGCSMGGCIAMQFATVFPQRVTDLTLIDTTASYGPDAASLWAQRAAAARADGMAALALRQVEGWLSETFREAHPEAASALVDCFGRTAITAFADSCAMLGTTDLRAALSGLPAGTRVIVGGDDRLTTVDAAQSLVAGIPQARLTVLDGACHLTPVERPGDIASLLQAGTLP